MRLGYLNNKLGGGKNGYGFSDGGFSDGSGSGAGSGDCVLGADYGNGDGNRPTSGDGHSFADVQHDAAFLLAITAKAMR